ncbi:beta-glucosidase [Halorubrum sp. Hd13]|uniref:beta-glucosidase family protein n=1 Tax=Halorubrum sp. Hd13 TaxID=1480728 RepID=UPI000B9860B9|nr:glycoside hydrolase family 3 C-terminal domain-containing protein [Halorubrum sp. Hd13]OYR47096.1 glycosyl hydrolase [Halorubrum sp. Hd13]
MTTEDVAAIVEELTLAEKVGLVHGATDTEGTATGFVPGVDRLGVPPVRLTDGPLGVRTDEPATAFPASTALAATFDTALAERFGRALGREATARNQDVLLGPGTNLIRVPHCGRNFEYFSEDPVHSGAFAASVVAGIQSADVVATPKHYVANSQETRRAEVSSEVDEPVLRELYLPAFRDAVGAGAGSVMSSYNRVNGTYVSEHERLLTEVLKGEWGFDGYVVSDWFGTESVVESVNAGLDLQMPGISASELLDSMGMSPDEEGDGDGASDSDAEANDEGDSAAADADDEAGSILDPDDGSDFVDGMPDPRSGGRYAEALVPAVERGDVPESRLDDMVTRILGSLDAVGHLDGVTESEPTGGGSSDDAGAIDTPEHRRLAVEIATRGTVLLKNDGVLPLADDADVAVIGPNVDEAVLGGGGSSEVTPFAQTAPREGIEARSEGAVSVARGLPRVEGVSLFDAMGEGGEDTADGGEADTADGSENADETAIDDGREPDVEGAVTAAAAADVAVVFVRDRATEAADRDSLRLPERQDKLIAAVADANDRTVVVANASGPIETPWLGDVAAVLAGWYPGQAHGEATAAVLYGDADPGGRLPVTFAPAEAYPTADERRFPGVDGEAAYDEGLLVGYRHFDAAGDEPTYPFGHGLSYAEFRYEDVEAVGPSTVEVTVANVADRAGREVVQAYVDSPDAPDERARPPRELAGFAAVELGPGESATVEIGLDERAFGRYDASHGWTVDAGPHVVSVGRSSRDRRGSATIER